MQIKVKDVFDQFKENHGFYNHGFSYIHCHTGKKRELKFVLKKALIICYYIPYHAAVFTQYKPVFILMLFPIFQTPFPIFQHRIYRQNLWYITRIY